MTSHSNENEYYLQRLKDQEQFIITYEEAKILNQWLRLHHGLFSSQPDYIHMLRLINGLGQLVDKYDRR